MSFKESLACIVITLFVVAVVRADDWRGIKPLRSTRADVERLLGQPDDPNKKHSLVYKTAKEIVIVDYANENQCKSGDPNAWRVPRDTVISITVSPRTMVPLSEFRFEESKYKKTTDIHRADVVAYTNKEDGVRIVVYQSNVQYINYFPSEKDNDLRCHDTQTTSDRKMSDFVYPALDYYHDISFENEKARLDSFALNLREQSRMLGYIIIYIRQRDRVSKAYARARRAKNYLINECGIEADRIKTKFGGRREKFTVELAMAAHRNS